MIRIAMLSGILALTACSGGPGLQIQASRPVHLVGGRPGLHVADAALEGGLPETALAITRGLLEADPSNVGALVKQGEALAALERDDAAAECYRRALAIDGKSQIALVGLGRLRLAAGQASDAESLFRRVVALAPGNAQALNNLGIALDMQDRHADAQQSYRTALQAAPDMVAAQTNLGLSYALAGDAHGAVAILGPLAADPASPERVRHDLAAVLAITGDAIPSNSSVYADVPATVSGGRAKQAAR